MPSLPAFQRRTTSKVKRGPHGITISIRAKKKDELAIQQNTATTLKDPLQEIKDAAKPFVDKAKETSIT